MWATACHAGYWLVELIFNDMLLSNVYVAKLLALCNYKAKRENIRGGYNDKIQFEIEIAGIVTLGKNEKFA